ncbi:MAG: MgtC/SapB family protein [Spongiibacteraceae bacterium]|jgi:putative Mg2+ transporter-C (MgtC) family protein|nr:MgtC/SapB family protein [Spongiibacteraceae bacterium]
MPTFEQALMLLLHLGLALAAGAAIGFERSFHGRAAGFRTHALVCTASSLLMTLSLYQWFWLETPDLEQIQTDPTRMAQGIMTGIGFLGAGVIYKEGASVHGLTTAASIWITAAIGILLGCGFWFPAALATAITLGVLSVFRWIEDVLPVQQYAVCNLGFVTDEVPAEQEVVDRLRRFGYRVSSVSYWMDQSASRFEYRMLIRGRGLARLADLAAQLRTLPHLHSLHVAPAGR